MGACTIANCEDVVIARGYCNRHYKRWRKHGDPLQKLSRPACTIANCDRPNKARGMCPMHYKRWRLYGDPAVVLSRFGPGNPHWAGDQASYHAVHDRLKASRGSASVHLCVDCGKQAEEWSYDRTDTQPLVEVRQYGRGKPRPVQYSSDLSRYAPRCNRCHRKHDRRKV